MSRLYRESEETIVYRGIRLNICEIVNMCHSERNVPILFIETNGSDRCCVCDKYCTPTNKTHINIVFYPYIDFYTAQEIFNVDDEQLGIIVLESLCHEHISYNSGDDDDFGFDIHESSSYDVNVSDLAHKLQESDIVVINYMLADQILTLYNMSNMNIHV
jgi:hypothetical protein